MAKRDGERTEHRTIIREPDGERGAVGYYLSLTVSNVRCFGSEPQTLNLTDSNGRPSRWTVLLGNNGTGKTTLLQLLAMMTLKSTSQFFASMTSSPSRVPGHPLPLSMLQWGDVASPRRPGVRDYPAEVTAVYSYNCRFDSNVSPNRVLSTHKVVDRTLSESRLVQPRIDLNCAAYGPSRRLGSSTLQAVDAADPCATLFGDDADLINAEEWLLRLDYSATKKSDIQASQSERREQVKRILCDLLPDVDDIRITHPTETAPTPAVQFQTPYGWVPLRELGHGYRTLVAWVVDFAARMVARYPESENPLAEPAVVLVDEIDLHLHPTWQRKVMGYLSERFPQTQFIATAHSPLIVQAAENANIALLRREGDHVVIDNDVKAIKNWRIDQILTSDLFGLDTARPPQAEENIKRRRQLLTKSRLTKKDRQELAGIEKELGTLPAGETAGEAEKLQRIVDQTQALLDKYGKKR